jgi:CubicO group peptidase (beta-lactamase class C family)
MKKVWVGLGALITIILVGLSATGNMHIIKAVQATYFQGQVTANINDGSGFNQTTIQAGDHQAFARHAQYNAIPLSQPLQNYLVEQKSAAFMILKDGKVWHESYYGAYTNRSQTNSFSMAKTVITLLIGAAIDEGYIKHFDQPISDFLPELKEHAKGVTIAQLSAMTSGMDWDENYYSPFSATPKLYYGSDSETFVLEQSYSQKPGATYYYSSASTQLLTLLLKRAIKTSSLSLSDYLSQRLWQPLGMNDDALWHTDEQGLELGYCCISTNVENWAKIAQLLLNDGQWQGKTIISGDFIRAIKKTTLVSHYAHSLWIDQRTPATFYALMGHLGQYTIIHPDENIVVLRLGETRIKDSDNTTRFLPSEIEFYSDEALKLVKSNP